MNCSVFLFPLLLYFSSCCGCFLLFYLWIKSKKIRQRNEEVSDKHEYLNCVFLLLFFSLSQWPHPPDGDGDQSGRGSGAQDPSQIRWPRICQRKRPPTPSQPWSLCRMCSLNTPPAEYTLTRSCLTRQTLLYKQAK